MVLFRNFMKVESRYKYCVCMMSAELYDISIIFGKNNKIIAVS